MTYTKFVEIVEYGDNLNPPPQYFEKWLPLPYMTPYINPATKSLAKLGLLKSSSITTCLSMQDQSQTLSYTLCPSLCLS